MIRVICALSLLGLIGCGADGAPIRPTADANVSIGTGGISTSAGVSISKGPISVGASF